MTRFKVGVQLAQQHCTVDELRAAWRAADGLGVDSIWLWDHFFPLSGKRSGRHFEGWSLLAALAADTSRAQFGMLVTCNSYRNPDLLADMARTVDHIGGGRLILGLGAGWAERDYDEYGYKFGTQTERAADLAVNIPRIKKRLAALNPRPVGSLPLLLGTSGKRIGLRLVAEHAQMWNWFGPGSSWAEKSRTIDKYCAEIGRDPAEIERSVEIDDVEEEAEDLAGAGAQHIILGLDPPFDLKPVEKLMDLARS